MSSIKLSPNASGTGEFTIAAPNSNTNRTLTLPDATGTLNMSGVANEVPAGSAGSPAIYPTGDTNTGIFFPAADTIAFAEGGVESARIDSSGNLLVNVTTSAGWGDGHRISKNTGQGNIVCAFDGQQGEASTYFVSVTTGGFSLAGAAQWVGRNGGTNRSINAGGTINASGADYAEYMTKAGEFTVAKGDVVGINADGKLTNVFADAVSFCVKSTDPSYVGGDIWGNEDAIGKRPGDDATDEEKAAYADALEAARQKVDRIAFAGQVPVNVMGATPGQYIVPVNDNGAIKGIAKNEADMTLADYMKSVGKVIAIQDDGRAFIIVKVA